MKTPDYVCVKMYDLTSGRTRIYADNVKLRDANNIVERLNGLNILAAKHRNIKRDVIYTVDKVG